MKKTMALLAFCLALRRGALIGLVVVGAICVYRELNRVELPTGKIQHPEVALALPDLVIDPGPAPSPKDDEFTVVHIPDTQRAFQENAHGIRYMSSIVDWIIDHKDSHRIAYAAHSGDLIETDSVESQWVQAREQMRRLGEEVPLGISPGNHDMSDWGDTANFRKWIGAPVSLNVIRGWAFVHGPCDPSDEELDEILKLLQRAQDSKRVVYVTHAFLGPVQAPETKQDQVYKTKGIMAWSAVLGARNPPLKVWERIRGFPKLDLILCGHQSRTRSFRIQVKREGLADVHVLLADYLGEAIRLMFVSQDRIRVRTCSPLQGGVVRGEDHEFEIRLNPSN